MTIWFVNQKEPLAKISFQNLEKDAIQTKTDRWSLAQLFTAEVCLL